MPNNSDRGKVLAAIPVYALFMLGPFLLLELRSSGGNNPPATTSVWKTAICEAELEAISELGSLELRLEATRIGALKGAEQDSALRQLKPKLESLVLTIPPAEADVILNDPKLQAQRFQAQRLQGDSRLSEIWRLRKISRSRLFGGVPLNSR